MLSGWAVVLLLLATLAAGVWVATSWLGETNLLVRLGIKNAGEERLPAVRADPPTSELLNNLGGSARV
jgi:hypothetical protein